MYNIVTLKLCVFKADLRDGPAQACCSSSQKCAVLQEPSEDAGCKRGHQT